MNISQFLSIIINFTIYNIPKILSLLLLIFLLFGWVFKKFVEKISNNKIWFTIFIVLILFTGIFLRLCFAYFFRGNFDIWYWDEITKSVMQGKNIYVTSNLYVYFPIWIEILKILKKINYLFPQYNFLFILRFFLTIIDLGTFSLLFLIAKKLKKSFVPIAIIFFLNPVSVIITGFHGQFENIAIFLILVGLYLYLKFNNKLISWLFITFGGITKHMFFNQSLFFLNSVIKKNKLKVIFLFLFSILIALLTLLPYWKEGNKAIINNLLFYSHFNTSYGVLFLLEKLGLKQLTFIYKYVFLLLFLLMPFLIKKKKIIQSSLIGVLFFISFAPGMSDQYFIMPIALGALTQSFWFYCYSLFASLYLFGSSAQFNISFFKIFSNNLIFIISLIWLYKEIKTKK